MDLKESPCAKFDTLGTSCGGVGMLGLVGVAWSLAGTSVMVVSRARLSEDVDKAAPLVLLDARESSLPSAAKRSPPPAAVLQPSCGGGIPPSAVVAGLGLGGYTPPAAAPRFGVRGAIPNNVGKCRSMDPSAHALGIFP